MTLSEAPLGIKRLGQVVANLYDPLGIFECHFTQTYQFRWNAKLRHGGVEVIPMWSVESGFKIDEAVKCVDLLIPCLPKIWRSVKIWSIVDLPGRKPH